MQYFETLFSVAPETPRSPRGAEQRGVHGGREGVRLRVPPGPVAHHHAAAHQEDHPGGRRGPEVDRHGRSGWREDGQTGDGAGVKVSG